MLKITELRKNLYKAARSANYLREFLSRKVKMDYGVLYVSNLTEDQLIELTKWFNNNPNPQKITNDFIKQLLIDDIKGLCRYKKYTFAEFDDFIRSFKTKGISESTIEELNDIKKILYKKPINPNPNCVYFKN